MSLFMFIQRYTVEDRAEMSRYILSAKESCRFHDQARFSALSLKPKIEALWSKVSVGHLARVLCYFPQFYSIFLTAKDTD